MQDSMTSGELRAAKDRLILRPYLHLRPAPEPYAHWSENAPPGTITDDSRNKIVLMYMLRNKLKAWTKKTNQKDLAMAYQKWLSKSLKRLHVHYDSLNQEWIKEINFACNYILDKKDSLTIHPSRLWNGLPTCWGQMTTLPLACIYPGDTVNAYLHAHALSFFDNGIARDLNASLVAGLSKALTLDVTIMTSDQIWTSIKQAMIYTDPFYHNKVPWCPRPIIKWLALADTLAAQSMGKPAVLYQKLNEVFALHEKWEAHVPVTVVFSVLHLCQYDAIAAWQLCLEWGWDTDTYAQLLGAFIGAIYGSSNFSNEWKSTVNQRLYEDYLESIEEWAEILKKWRDRVVKKKIY
jgi:ADP-ribosylglycohydrolase